MRNSQLPVNIFNSINSKNKTKIDNRLYINKKGGPLIHMKVDNKSRDDLFVLENEDSEVIMRLDCKGNLLNEHAVNIETTENIVTPQKTSEEKTEADYSHNKFDNGIVMGCWRIIPTEENLLIQKNINGVWITKQLLT